MCYLDTTDNKRENMNNSKTNMFLIYVFMFITKNLERKIFKTKRVTENLLKRLGKNAFRSLFVTPDGHQ